MILKDNRSPAEQHTHTALIGGRDNFLSSWGQCGPGKGSSFAYWACEPDQEDQVRGWVESRGEINLIDIETVLGTEATLPGDQMHIYRVNADHPALNPEEAE